MLPGDRRSQAHRRAPTTGPGHGRRHRVDDERSRSAAAGEIIAPQSTGERAGTRLAVDGDGTTLRLLAGRVGAALRPQRHLGIAAAGAGGGAAGSDPAASARRQAGGGTGDEVSGAGSTCRSGGLRADGRRLGQASLQHAASRATLCRLAGRYAGSSRTRARRAGTVFENAAAGALRQSHAGCSGARSGDGRCHPAPRRPAAGRSSAGDDWSATGTCAAADRKRAPRTGADDGAHRNGTGRATC